jgi:hypothetical protein
MDLEKIAQPTSLLRFRREEENIAPKAGDLPVKLGVLALGAKIGSHRVGRISLRSGCFLGGAHGRGENREPDPLQQRRPSSAVPRLGRHEKQANGESAGQKKLFGPRRSGG